MFAAGDHVQYVRVSLPFLRPEYIGKTGVIEKEWGGSSGMYNVLVDRLDRGDMWGDRMHAVNPTSLRRLDVGVSTKFDISQPMNLFIVKRVDPKGFTNATGTGAFMPKAWQCDDEHGWVASVQVAPGHREKDGGDGHAEDSAGDGPVHTASAANTHVVAARSSKGNKLWADEDSL